MEASDDIKRVIVAVRFATIKHGKQVRKYTGDPYVAHCFEVAHLVAEHGGTTDQIIAAILHDTVEDTNATLEEIQFLFGPYVEDYVYWLTDISKPEDGNRAARKKLDREHIARAPAEAQNIKVADLISNTSTIVEHDPDFAKVYLKEKALLLEAMTKADPDFVDYARKQMEGAR